MRTAAGLPATGLPATGLPTNRKSWRKERRGKKKGRGGRRGWETKTKTKKERARAKAKEKTPPREKTEGRVELRGKGSPGGVKKKNEAKGR